MVTVLFLGVAFDGDINLIEAIILVAGYLLYVVYVLFHKDEKQLARRAEMMAEGEVEKRPRLSILDFVVLLGGACVLIVGANYLVDSIVELSLLFGITTGAITITAVALGTSLPELFVSARATMNGKSEVALGNIFGSNIFNLLVVVGLPGLVTVIPLGPQTLAIGLPALAAATFLFVVSGISRQIHLWEGSFFLFVYVVFIAKLFGLF